MAYTAKTWVNNSAPSVCAANLNDLETGVADAHTTADAAVAKGVLQAKGDLIGALSASSPTRVVGGADNTVLVADSAQTHGLKWVQIGNAQVLAAAAIAYSKLNLASSIVNADVGAGAAIAYSKLALAGSIVNADIASSASISAPKIAGFPADSTKFLRGDATWAAPAAAAALFVLISDTTLGSAAASIDVQNIPATSAHLLATGQALCATVGSSDVLLFVRMNADSSTANYDGTGLNVDNTTVTGGRDTTLGYLPVGWTVQATGTYWAAFQALVADYAQSARYKAMRADGGAFGQVKMYWGRWESTTAVDRLTFALTAGNLETGTRLTLYGLDV